MNLGSATPAEIDAQISRIHAEMARVAADAERAEAIVVRYHDAKAQGLAWYGGGIEAAKTRIDDAAHKLSGLAVEIVPFEEEFTRRGGWSRYFLITDGHLHYDVSYSRCSRTSSSDHYWVTRLSGLSVEEAIEAAGDRVCTLCFPNAPVITLTRRSTLSTPTECEREAARIERDRVREKKAAKAKAAAIFDIDGGPLLDRSGHVLATERAAMVEYRDIAADLVYYRDKEAHDRNRGAHQSVEEHEASRTHMLAEYTRTEQRIVAALAAKHGVSIDDERETHAKPVSTRVRKDAKAAAEFRAQHPGLFAKEDD